MNKIHMTQLAVWIVNPKVLASVSLQKFNFFDAVVDDTDCVIFAADNYNGKGDDISVQLSCIS